MSKVNNHRALVEQVIVITGASSGIGLATAQMAAERGARVVLAARSSAIHEIAASLPTETLAVQCDVASRADLERLAEQTINRFHQIDTWVNNAGVSIFGLLEEVSEEDSRQLFETNFWGIYNGSLVALQYLREKGGAIINIGSEVSEAVLPLQGIYSASKHAVKGFTDALRIEVEEVLELPVSLTLIQPTAVDTPYPLHAKNYMDQEAKLPTPQISPEDVAEAILEAAVSPVRYKKVGMLAKIDTTLSRLMPGISDKIAAFQTDRQKGEGPARHVEGALYRSSETTGIVGVTHGPGSRG